MKKSYLLTLLTGFLLAGCGKSDPKADPKADSNDGKSSSGNPLTAPVDYLGAVGKAKKVAEKTVSSAGTTQAIQFFQAEKGRFPKDLNELVVEGYLPKLPTAPPGMKLDYNPSNGQLKVIPK